VSKKLKSLAEPGRKILRVYGREACEKGYRIDADDLEEVGRQALLHGDIRPDGTLN